MTSIGATAPDPNPLPGRPASGHKLLVTGDGFRLGYPFMKNTLLVASLLSLIVLSACCAFDANVPTNEEFVRKMNSEVGTVKSFATYPGWARLTSETRTDGTIWYTADEASGCSVGRVVDAKSHLVISWRYLSDPGSCKATRYYCGPW